MTPEPAHDGGRLVLRSALLVGLILRMALLWYTLGLGGYGSTRQEVSV